MLGLSKFIERGFVLENAQEVMAAFSKLVISLSKLKANAQAISTTLRAVGVLVKHDLLKYQDVKEAVSALLERFKTQRFLALHACNVLFALSEIGVQDGDDLANWLFSHLRFDKRGKRDTLSLRAMLRAILGYARLVQQLPEDALIKEKVLQFFRLFEKMKLHVRLLLQLIRAYHLLKEKKADAICDAINIGLFVSRFHAADPTQEEKEEVGRLIPAVPKEAPSPLEPPEVVPVFGGLFAYSQESVKLHSMPKPVTYDLATKEGQEALREHYKTKEITFVPEEVPLIVMPIAVLGGDLGVVAGTRLEAKRFLGNYHGEVLTGEKAVQGSMYAFCISDDDDEEEKFLDAKRVRNFGALLNHNSLLANVVPVNEEGSIKFSIGGEPIGAHAQCFIDYGKDFFPLLGFDPRYMDPQDDWKSFDQLVLDNHSHYLNSCVYVSSELQTAFKLPTQKVVVTKLVEAILAGSEEESLELVKSQAHLWNYCVEKERLLPPERQQRFSPLMLACYLGQTRVVKELLKFGYVNRQLLQTAETAIFFTLTGKAPDRTALFKLLLDNGAYYNHTNRDGVSLLNIAVEEDIPGVVHLLLDKKPTSERDELLELFLASRKKDSLYEAMISGKLGGARALLEKTTQMWLCPKVVDREILILKALKEQSATARHHSLQMLMETAKIHKNFGAVQAIVESVGPDAKLLVDEALKAKKWPHKEAEALQALNLETAVGSDRKAQSFEP